MEEYQFKATFTIKWGTVAYRKMPFGLSNTGSTFQRAMDIAFEGIMKKFVPVYLDDITIFSKDSNDHFVHLRKIF